MNSTVVKSLCKLDVKHTLGVTGKLSRLLGQGFPSLHRLVLSNCKLNSLHLRSLAQAEMDGKLPQLKQLDLSHNKQPFGKIDDLFQLGCMWQGLLSLNFEGCSSISFPYLNRKVQCGCLSLLEELIFSTDVDISKQSSGFVPLPFLQTLHFYSQVCSTFELVPAITSLVEKNLFPVVQIMHVNADELLVHSDFSSNITRLRVSLSEDQDPHVVAEILQARNRALEVCKTRFHELHPHTSGSCELPKPEVHEQQVRQLVAELSTSLFDSLRFYKRGSDHKMIVNMVEDYLLSALPVLMKNRPGLGNEFEEAFIDFFAAQVKLARRNIVVFVNTIADRSMVDSSLAFFSEMELASH